MLYLEDYLEMIEHLPQELRDRFTYMREMDLSVQNNMDSLEKRIRTFFGQCKRNELPNPDTEFQALRKDYYKILEDADEKVSLETQMYELVERYLRRLDSELFKFKLELEADNNGITEILEKRSLELDGNSSKTNLLNQKENRYFGAIGSNNVGGSGSQKEHRYRPKPEKRRDSTSSAITTASVLEHKRPNLGNNMITNQSIQTSPAVTTIRPTHHQVISTTQTINSPTIHTSSPATVSLGFQHLGAGGAIAAAATQAIVATQQMQQGRRTASLKASYEAIHGNSGAGSHELLGIGRELAGATHNVIQTVEREGNSLHGQRKQHKKKLTASGLTSVPGPSSVPSSPLPPIQLPGVETLLSPRLNENGLVVEQTPDGEWTYDPNEPRYCICNQVSYGDMVACDNEACPFEWFHYPCVGITQSPKGKWYCPKCIASMRRRGNRKN